MEIKTNRTESRLYAIGKIKMMTYHLLFILLGFLLSGCMLINPVKRMDLEEITFRRPMPKAEQRIVVLFEEVVPGRPLNETVWDSAIGPYWDQDESQQIGVTVSYRVDPIMMAGGATAVTTAQGARWVVPFGPLMSHMMKSALEQHFLKSVICYTNTCVENAITSGEVSSLLRIKPAFKVWTPAPTSLKLNYSSSIAFGVYSSPSLQLVRSGNSSFSWRDMQLNRIISYKAISEMRDYSKEYAEEAIWAILTRAYGVE